MTGMRGNPCKYLHQHIHVLSGKSTYECSMLDEEGYGECVGGVWCPIVGDKRYHIVKG